MGDQKTCYPHLGGHKGAVSLAYFLRVRGISGDSNPLTQVDLSEGSWKLFAFLRAEEMNEHIIQQAAPITP